MAGAIIYTRQTLTVAGGYINVMMKVSTLVKHCMVYQK